MLSPVAARDADDARAIRFGGLAAGREMAFPPMSARVTQQNGGGRSLAI
jgi:hypothetical protein